MFWVNSWISTNYEWRYPLKMNNRVTIKTDFTKLAFIRALDDKDAEIKTLRRNFKEIKSLVEDPKVTWNELKQAINLIDFKCCKTTSVKYE